MSPALHHGNYPRSTPALGGEHPRPALGPRATLLCKMLFILKREDFNGRCRPATFPSGGGVGNFIMIPDRWYGHLTMAHVACAAAHWTSLSSRKSAHCRRGDRIFWRQRETESETAGSRSRRRDGMRSGTPEVLPNYYVCVRPERTMPIHHIRITLHSSRSNTTGLHLYKSWRGLHTPAFTWRVKKWGISHFSPILLIRFSPLFFPIKMGNFPFFPILDFMGCEIPSGS